MVYSIESVGIAAMRRKIPDSFSIIAFRFYSDIGIFVGQNLARWFWARNLARCFWRGVLAKVEFSYNKVFFYLPVIAK